MPLVDLTLADQPMALIVARAAEHDPAATTEIRWRIHAAVSFELAERFGSRTVAQHMLPAAMDALQDALPGYPAHSDFDRWMKRLITDMPLED